MGLKTASSSERLNLNVTADLLFFVLMTLHTFSAAISRLICRQRNARNGKKIYDIGHHLTTNQVCKHPTTRVFQLLILFRQMLPEPD